MKRIKSIWILLSCMLCLGGVCVAKDETEITIEPGATVMSEEERAIEADPDQGIEHGVILLEETDRNESLRVSNLVTYHLRAKILSNEGRSLADVTIPFNSDDSKLKQWWGRTILPDGEVLELGEEELEEQLVAEHSEGDYSVLKGSLPGVVPGCVIDYGYQVKVEGFIPPDPVNLQRAWPVRQLRYRWKPWREKPSAYFVAGGDRVPVDFEQSNKGMLVTASDIPPVVEEPYMPPDSVVRAVLYLYYTDSTEPDTQEFWDESIKGFNRYVERFSGSKSLCRKTLEEIAVPADTDLAGKLRYVYEWIAANIENTTLRTAAEKEAVAAAEDEEKEPENMRDVLKLGRGADGQLDMLFLSLARALGAEAYPVLVVDRTDGYWQPQLRQLDQFASVVTAVKMPGDGGQEYQFADAGSGLPFGHLTWWVTGVPAVLVTKDGARQVAVPAQPAQENQYVTRASVEFVEDNEIVEATWERTGSGQCGVSEKRRLRRRKTEDREERLRKLCGESADLEVVSAELAHLGDLGAQYELHCTAELLDRGVDEDADVHRHRFDGPWIKSLPDLTAEERVHPVIFAYPRIDQEVVEVKAPEGYVPRGAPEPVAIDSPFGGYRLRISVTEDGYLVERATALARLSITPEDYAAFREHLNAVRRADRTELVFERAPEGS